MRRPHLFGLAGTYRFARLSPAPIDVAEPLTYMNRSGAVLAELLERFGTPPSRLIVVTDNLDLPAGITRLKRRGGAASHNGLKSVTAALGSDDYPRLYIGIGHPGDSERVIEHVLSAPAGKEAEMIERGVVRAAETVLQLPVIGFDQAMHELNRKE